MKTILNIGLGPSKAAPQGISLGRAVDAVMREFGSASIEFPTVVDGEPTLVVVIDERLSDATRLYTLAESLDQDCIAAVQLVGGLVSTEGLYGPHAPDWGPFRRDLFLFPTRNI